MNSDNYVGVDFGDETYFVAPEGGFLGDDTREDIRVLDQDEVSDYEMGIEHVGTVVGLDPSSFDSTDQMYEKAVERAEELNSGSEPDFLDF
jgi:hypothetical protein